MKESIILGIDPGSRIIGYGIVKKIRGGIKYLKSGYWQIQSLPEAEKKITKLINQTKPDAVGLEKIFFSKNKKTAIAVAQTRGVILNAILKQKKTIIEIAPNKVKSIVAGNGLANKKKVAEMVGLTLNIKTKQLIDDETDALAIAIATCFIKRFEAETSFSININSKLGG